MILSQLPETLRRLAAQIERGSFDPDTRVSLCLYSFGISTADELQKWTKLMGPRCEHDGNNCWFHLSDFQTGSCVSITANYESSAIVSELVGEN